MEETTVSFEQLGSIANKLRQDIVRMLHKSGSGHPGGSLSAIDIITYLYYQQLKRTRENSLAIDRHRFVLSKGHGVPALYAVLAEMGLIEKSALDTLREIDSPLQGHPDVVRIPYVEASTGSLGQGLSIAQGMAMAAKLDNFATKVFCLVGDGEIQEGQIWEAILSAAKFKLGNLIIFLDYNKGQIDGYVKDVMPIEPINEKLLAFNWDVHSIDGHDFQQIHEATEKAIANVDSPSFIIAHTIKGKGVSFMEDKASWHGKAPNDEELEKALIELRERG
ncbi:transketolase [Candidatus Riflebacteria bacterium]